MFPGKSPRCPSSLYFSFLLFLGCASVERSGVESGTLPGSDLVAVGRTALSEGQLELIGSASHFQFGFEGKQCRMYVSLSDWQTHNYLQYELDGVYQKRVRIGKNDPQPVLISASGEGSHTLTVYKATEAHTGPVFIRKITAARIRSVKPSSAPLIEFIGNSITCGAAADPSEVPCGTGAYHDQHNGYMAYGPRVARTLNADFMLSSVSGIGIYRNWNSEGPTMPQVYGNTDFQQGGNRLWKPNTHQPAVVSIALGTNDLSDGDGKKPRLAFDSAAFVTHSVSFVRQLKSNYPKARIALLSSPMLNGQRRLLLQNCLLAVKAQIDHWYPADPDLAVYFFKPMQARGCTGHPSVDDHRILAQEVTPFFKGLLENNLKTNR